MKQSMQAAAAAAASILLALTACEGSNPVRPAVESGKPELVAFALEGSYTIVQGRALEVARDPATPAAVVAVVQSIDATVNPILDAAKPLAKEAEAVRKEVESCGGAPACESKEDLLVGLLNQLNGILTSVSPLINDLIKAIGGGS